MATLSLEDYIKQQKNASSGQMAADIKTVNDTFNANVDLLQQNYDAEVAETEQGYNNLYDQNAVNRIINERKISENMANLGLTDSGLNRTQQTANQLSYANTNNQIGIEKQKAIDTLALAMRNKKTELEIQKNNDIASIKSQYEKDARSNAVSMYNADLQAQGDAQKRREAMYDDYYGSNGVFNFMKETIENDVGDTVSKNSNQEKANRFSRWLMQYADVMSGDEIDRWVSQLEPDLANMVYDVLGDNGYLFYRETPAVKDFFDSVLSKEQFEKSVYPKQPSKTFDGSIDFKSFGKEKEVNKYNGNWRQYIEDQLKKNEDKLTKTEMYTLMQYYGLI